VSKEPKRFITKVKIQNYKSIGRCVVEIKPFTLLVGPNGSGKSNFLDALRFVADSLRTTPEHAFRERGGIGEVRRKSSGHPNNFGIGLNLRLPNNIDAFYAFKIGALPNGGFTILNEVCKVGTNIIGLPPFYFEIKDGVLIDSSSKTLPTKIENDRLYLVLASALPEFASVYEKLSKMGFYNLNPDRIKDLQDTDPGDLLKRSGENIAAVVRRLKSQNGGKFERIVEYLKSVIPGIEAISHKSLGPKETLEFRQMVAGEGIPWKFLATNMSDGTLRALGALVAVFQSGNDGKGAVPFVGIEEPETAIHPGATQKLMDALLEGQYQTQLAVTTHSPDLLDHDGITADSLLAVTNQGGETLIAPVDEASIKAVQENLYTVGELLRLGQLEPNEEKYKESISQLDLLKND
jgi:predicted ATPase